MITTIKVSDKVYRFLKKIKEELNFKSMNNTLYEILREDSENPYLEQSIKNNMNIIK